MGASLSRVRATVAAAALVAAAFLPGCGGDGGDGDRSVPLSDHLVFSIGDSVASGEGNPDARVGPLRKAVWQNRRCHRSLRSGQALAASGVLGGQDRYISLACSGGRIDVGLLGPYRGVEPDLANTLEPPQIERMAGLAEGRTIDAVMLSVGANDIGFSKIVKFCAIVTRCWRRRFDPALPLTEQYRARRPLAVSVPEQIAGLADGYRRIDESLPDALAAERVLIVEYFDATSGPGGRPCAFLGGVDRAESAWAREHALRALNERIRASAEELGWTLVQGVDEAFRGHGICAGVERWVQTLDESLNEQGSGLLGTLHPNPAGHRATAALIAPALAPLVAGPGGTETGP